MLVPTPTLFSRLLRAVLVASFAIACPTGAQADDQTVLVFPDANSRETYFTVHRIRAAQAYTRGKGARIGILDTGLGFESHRDLYAGGCTFQSGADARHFASAEHGYWMALAARAIAPEAQLYALGTWSRDENAKVEAMVKAIDWAIEHHLDAITYSGGRFPAHLRARLDAAVSRAVAAGVVVCFIHYPHPENLLPTGLFPRHPVDDEREPDVNILHYDYNVVFVKDCLQAVGGRTREGFAPFLSMSATSPVTAAIVALMRSVNPGLTPAQCKQILMSTARPMTFEGKFAARAVNAAAALRAASGLPKAGSGR